ncbi:MULTISPECIES: acetyltransferase [unclassified Flavobacterium]|uniref:acetyltransferase n=1 Tax=unclassified Flavobacterium TaxID=196869 RepID=UPI0012A7FFA7|nr:MULTISPECIES: acetyltransferase [unclassified Flavobacterium]MBF4486006.1 acetyltransferase [Flavobacterium sp. CSZ]QGK76863.1 acetyltransferase [Flavobacterium sp. SLB02]
MKNIVIIGAGGFGREVKMLIDQINLVEKKFNLLGFYDDNISIGTQVNGYPVLGGVNDLMIYNNEISVVISIADPKIKFQIHKSLKINSNISFPTLIHPNVLIGTDSVLIGEGCIICASNIITVNISIGNFVILNLFCTTGHDTVIGDYCSFMPSVNISGEVVIEDLVYVGTGAKIINLLKIGNSTIIGAGAVVSKTLPEKCTAVGIPAKPIKFHE